MNDPTPRTSIFVRPSRRLRGWTWANRLSKVVFLGLLISGRYLSQEWFQGNTAATRLFGVLHLVDPFGALEVMLASRQIYVDLLIGAGIILILYALLGRVFCGWICPLGLVLDLNEDIRRRFISKRDGKRLPRQIKYIALGMFLLLSLLTKLPVFTMLSPINILTRNILFGIGPEIAIVVAIIAIDLFVSRRLWCRSLCPLGAFYSLIGRFSFLHIRIRNQGASCTRCAACVIDCPMGINPLKNNVIPGNSIVTDPECTRCGTCLEGCEGGSLHLGVERGS